MSRVVPAATVQHAAPPWCQAKSQRQEPEGQDNKRRKLKAVAVARERSAMGRASVFARKLLSKYRG